ncbi:MAG TPA: APH(3') family aminoglycoside O-phosphotransferase [Ktedonobacteraceae bacterium]|nr:APH(3') family aminoglycoside O-phosphotransferase [Ktedonobacteraceae bacterium]
MDERAGDWINYLPADLRGQLDTTHWRAITVGRSGTRVFRVKDGYLKINLLTASHSLQAEKERLQWLQGRLPVPQVYYYGRDAAHEYLLLSAIPGTMSCDPVFKENMPELIHLLAEALHMLHAVDITNCPFDARLPHRLSAQQRALNKPRVASQTQEQDIKERYEQLLQMFPASEDLVFTHGDFCLPNIIIDRRRARISGFIDWERGGIADRHIDLERTCWSLSYNFDTSWIPSLLEAYGLKNIDQGKMLFYGRLEDLDYLLGLTS